MLLTDKRYKRFLLLLLGGVLTGLTLVVPEIGFLEWLTLVPAGIFLLAVADGDKVHFRGMYGYGFFFFLCFYAVVFHWFINLYPLEFIDGMTPIAALGVVLAGCIGLSALQAFFGGFMFATVKLLFRMPLMKKYTVLRPFAVAGLWAIYEWSQNIGWWGVPWGRLPIGQSKYIVGLQTASLFGSYFITFLLVAVNMCVAFALLNIPKARIMNICVAAMLAFNYGVGTVLYFIPENSTSTIRVAAVQGNISSNEKWSPLSTQRTREVYAKYTLQAAAEGADIVVWPETALPYDVLPDNKHGRFCSELAVEAGVTILVGGFTPSEEGRDQNSIICILPDGSFHEDIYVKRRLVPFGEYVPLEGLIQALLPPLAELVMSDDDIVAGEGAQLIELDGVNVGPLICFDSIYDSLSRESVRDGAQLITLSSNDSWFTDSAALYMHNAQAQMRAIENSIGIVRAANTGISTIINSKGEVVERLEPLVDGMIISDVSISDTRTLYSYIGNAVLIPFGLLLAYIFVDGAGKKISEKITKNSQTA